MMQPIQKVYRLLDRRERRNAAGVLVVMFLVAAVEVLGVASIMPFIAVLSNPDLIETNPYLKGAFDFLGFSSTNAFLLLLGAVTLTVLTVSLLARAVGMWVQKRFVANRTYAWSVRLLTGYLRQPYQWFLNRNSAEFATSLLAEVGTATKMGLLPAIQLVAQVFVIGLLVALLMVVDLVLTLIVAGVFGLMSGLLVLVFREPIRRKGAERRAANEARYRAMSEISGAIKEVKVGDLELASIRRFSKPAKRLASREVAVGLLSNLPPLLMQFVFFGGMLGVLLYLVATYGGFQQAVPIVALFGFAGYRMYPAFSKAYGDVAKIKSAEAAIDVLYRDFLEFGGVESAVVRSRPPARRQRRGLQSELKLDDVVYAYPGSDRPSLAGVTIEVPALTTVGLVGSTGSGKTTTVDAMLGLLRPQKGRLVVDDVVLEDADLPGWRRAIGYVPQSIFLTDDTIAANIAFGFPDDEIDMAAVERAGEAANLDEFVKRLPEGYQTQVGERGVRLSGGQRQRIGIARALYHDPDVLILDEATSALDNLTEQVVMEAVRNLGRKKTIILIAHRLSTVRQCDRIYLLEDGRVSAWGSYDELVVQDQRFRAMAAAGH